MFVLCYTSQDILTALGVFVAIALVVSLGTVLVVGATSSVVIKKTTKLNWASSCLVGLVLGFGACNVMLFSPAHKEPVRSLKIASVKSEHPVFAVGVKRRFEAIGITKSGHERPVAATWASSGPGLVIDSKGVAQAVKPGSYTLTAKLDGMKATIAEVVSDQEVESIRVDPETAEVKVGAFVKYKVIARWSDGSETDVSLVAKYRSSAEAKLTVNSSRTHAFANKPGDFIVTVDYLGAQSFSSVRVVPLGR